MLMAYLRFLLAQLHMDSLKDKTSPKAIKKALKDLPTGPQALDLAYREAISRIQDQMDGLRSLAIQALGWLTCARRHLSVTELLHALAIEIGESKFDEENLYDADEVLSVCAGLVIVDNESDIIRLVHYTAEEYFKQNMSSIFPDIGQHIAMSCLTYLLYDDFNQGWLKGYVEMSDGSWEFQGLPTLSQLEAHNELGSLEQENPDDKLATNQVDSYEDDRSSSNGSVDTIKVNSSSVFASESIENHLEENDEALYEARTRLFPFVGYAAEYCLFHANSNLQDNVVAFVIKFVNDAKKISSAMQIVFRLESKDYDTNRVYRSFCDQGVSNPIPSGIYVLAYFGCNALIWELLSLGYDADGRDLVNRSPLWWASYHGHETVVELLLKHGNIEVTPVDAIKKFTPLSIAAEYGMISIAKMLLACGDVDVNCGTRNPPLVIAVEEGHYEIINLLLEREDILVNLPNEFGYTALTVACKHEEEGLVRRLLGRSDVQVNYETDTCKTPLFIAVQWGWETVVEMLLEHPDIDMNRRTLFNITALQHAVLYDHPAIVKMLIEHPKIDVNFRGADGNTALILAASEEEKVGMIDLLLQHSEIDINIENNDGNTALTMAVTKNLMENVKTLLTRADLDLDLLDREGRDIIAQAEHYVEMSEVKEESDKDEDGDGDQDSDGDAHKKILTLLREEVARRRNAILV